MGHLQLKFLPQEHAILRQWRALGFAKSPLIVAVSGGLDSVVLLSMLKRLHPVMQVSLVVTHIDHGPGKDQQVAYRQKVKKWVRGLAHDLELPFETNSSRPQKILKSEEEMRDFRYKELERVLNKVRKKKKGEPILVLAHHQDDLLETQMLRLVRGTGLEGLRAMRSFGEGRWRPLLEFSREELLQVARALKVQWIEDPSNRDLDPRRNWMRHEWLPALEKKIPGAKASLMRSLKLLVEGAELRLSDKAVTRSVSRKSGKNQKVTGVEDERGEVSIRRMDYLALSPEEKRAYLVKYLKTLKIKSFSYGQVEEIRKRLDNRRREYTFNLLKHRWSVNAEQIQARSL